MTESPCALQTLAAPPEDHPCLSWEWAGRSRNPQPRRPRWPAVLLLSLMLAGALVVGFAGCLCKPTGLVVPPPIIVPR